MLTLKHVAMLCTPPTSYTILVVGLNWELFHPLSDWFSHMLSFQVFRMGGSIQKLAVVQVNILIFYKRLRSTPTCVNNQNHNDVYISRTSSKFIITHVFGVHFLLQILPYKTQL